MGGSYSDLHVYFRTKKGGYSGTGYSVTTTHDTYSGCSCFFERCHEIQFTNGNALRHNVILYDSYSTNDKKNYVFAYCHPGNSNEVVKKVRVYYSVLAPEHPLVISFETKIKKYDCYYKQLKAARWDYASHITEYSIGKPLDANILDAEFKKLSLNKKIKLTTNSDKVDVKAYRQQLDKSVFRFIFASKGIKSVMGSELLFSMDFKTKEPKRAESTANGNKNQIDSYFLHSVKGHFFDGIMVYFARGEDKPKPKRKPQDYEGTALLVEFIDSTNGTIQFKRIDNDGYCWSEEKVDSKDDKRLITTLKEMKERLEQNTVTIILDEKRQYEGLESFEPGGTNKVCIKYTYKFKSANKPIMIFKRKTITITAKGISEVKAKNVEVYYLQASGKVDTQPFLIVTDENNDGTHSKKHAYHFINTNKFDEWVEFTYKKQAEMLKEQQLMEKLYDKVRQIETNGSCIPNLTLLRWYAYQILIDPEISTPPSPPTKVPEKPKIEEPTQPPEELPVWLIVGCVAAGVVLIVAAAVGYGIYWYNTTIKLLT